MERNDRRQFLTLRLLAGIFVLLSFLSLSARALWEPDEGRYADIAATMARTGNWIVPYVNGVPHLDKPPLVYWVTGMALKAFGLHEWVARLGPWLSATGLIALTLAMGLRMGGFPVAFASTAILGSSLLWTVFGALLNLDMAIAFCISLTLFCFWKIGEQAPDRQFWIRFWFWMSMSLGFLVKGLIAAVLPLGVVVVLALVERRWELIKRLWSPVGLGLAVVLPLPWLLALEAQIPGFNYYFFVHEHFLRYVSPIHRRESFPLVYVWIILAGFLPWSLAFFTRGFWSGAVSGWKERPFDRFLLVWVGVIFAFFSASHSQLLGYILPAALPLAVFLGRFWAFQGASAGLRRGVWTTVGFLGLLALVMGASRIIVAYVEEEPLPLEGLFFLALMGGFAWLLRKTTGIQAAFPHVQVVLAGLALACGWLVLTQGTSVLDADRSAKGLAKVIRNIDNPETLIIAFRTYPRTLAFYLQRPILMTTSGGEQLNFQVPTMDGKPRLITEDDVGNLVKAGKPVVIVLKENRWESHINRLKAVGVEVQDYGQKGNWRLLGTEDPAKYLIKRWGKENNKRE